MSYKLKLILYIVSKTLLYACIIGFAFSLVMLTMDNLPLEYWLYRALSFFVILVIATILYLVRKSKFPLPGKDYK